MLTPTSSDYIRTHRLLGKYGYGLALVCFAGLASTFNADPASVLTLKMMIAIPFAIVLIWLPSIFDHQRSRTPFTPSFVERTFIEGLLFGVGITMANWTPDMSPLRMILGVTVILAVYFGIRSFAYTIIQRTNRR